MKARERKRTYYGVYSYEINRRLGVPVFDMVTLVHWFHRALRPQHFPQG
jgi:hypothetical protein